MPPPNAAKSPPSRSGRRVLAKVPSNETESLSRRRTQDFGKSTAKPSMAPTASSAARNSRVIGTQAGPATSKRTVRSPSSTSSTSMVKTDHDVEINGYKEEIAKLKQEHKDAITELQGKHGEKVAQLELEARMAGFDKSDGNENLQADLDNMKTEVTVWQAKWRTADSELARVRSSNLKQATSITELEGKNNELRKLDEEKSEEVVKLRIEAGKIPGLETRISELESTTARVQGLQSTIDKLEKEKVELEDELKSNCAELEKEMVALEEKLAEAEKAQGEHETAARLKEKLEDSVVRICALEKENTELRAHILAETAHFDLSAQLGAQVEELDEKLVAAVGESRSKDATILSWQDHFAQLEKEAGELRNQVKELEIYRSIHPQPVNNILTRTLTVRNPDDDANGALTSPESPMAAGEEQPALPSTVSHIDPANNPLAQLKNIVIKIDPADRTHWTWVQKMRAALPKKAPLEINGDPAHVQELNLKMSQHITFVEEMKLDVKDLEKEIRALKKRNLCVDPEHKSFKTMRDTLDAKEQQIALSRFMLQNDGLMLRGLQEQLDEARRELRALKHGSVGTTF